MSRNSHSAAGREVGASRDQRYRNEDTRLLEWDDEPRYPNRSSAVPPTAVARGSQEPRIVSSLQNTIQCPPYIPVEEWIYAKTRESLQFLGRVVWLNNKLCDEDRCPAMITSEGRLYHWKGRRVPAREYLTSCCDWALEVTKDTSPYMPRDGQVSEAFIPTIREVHRRVARLYAHVYLHHEDQMRQQDGVVDRVDCVFHLWLLFVREFDLVQESDLAPLRSVINTLEAEAEEGQGQEGRRVADEEESEPRSARGTQGRGNIRSAVL